MGAGAQATEAKQPQTAGTQVQILPAATPRGFVVILITIPPRC